MQCAGKMLLEADKQPFKTVSKLYVKKNSRLNFQSVIGIYCAAYSTAPQVPDVGENLEGKSYYLSLSRIKLKANRLECNNVGDSVDTLMPISVKLQPF